MIEIHNVTKQYNSNNGVHEVSTTIPKGKITTFIGPNGAGKSTLLSMVSRLLRMDEGKIHIDGLDILATESSQLAQKISILKQANHTNVRLTVLELVEFGRFPYSKGRLTAEDRQQVRDALTYMELEQLEQHYIDELSGGQRQRAFIAMVLAQDTDYILLDEPLNSLDMKHCVQIMKVLRRLVEERGKTVILVLHDINFASIYSDYMIALKGGRIIREGPTVSIMDTAVLKEIYDMDIPIQIVDGNRLGLYYK